MDHGRPSSQPYAFLRLAFRPELHPTTVGSAREDVLTEKMFTPVGGFGDILALSKLILQIGGELKSIPDSAPAYQDLLNELEALDRALKQIYHIRPGVHDLKRLDGVRALASTCQAPLQEFLGKIQKFKKSLGPWNCGRHRLHGFGRGVQWSLMWKEEVQTLRSKLTPKLSAILILLTSQIMDSLAQAESDRVRIGHELSAKLASQQDRLAHIEKSTTAAEQDAGTRHVTLLDAANSQGHALATLESKVVDQGLTSEAHLDAQDTTLQDIQQQGVSSADKLQTVSTSVENVQQEVALIKAGTGSVLDLMIRMARMTMERFSRLQQIAELITDLLRWTVNMTKESKEHLLQLLREFKEVRQQLVRMERYLPMQMHYPMIQFRDAFNNVTPFPYHVFREWEGAKRMVAAIFVNRQGLRRVEMGQWFVTHVGRGIPRVDPRFWSNVLQPGDELSMTMILTDIQAKEGFCPYPSCGADTSAAEIVRGGRYCPKCCRFAELSPNQAATTNGPRGDAQSEEHDQEPATLAVMRSPKRVTEPVDTYEAIGAASIDVPEAPQPEGVGREDIEEYYFIQVVQMSLIEPESSSQEPEPANEYITIFVQQLGHKTLCFRLAKSTEIQDIKTIIYERGGTPEVRQRLSFGGKQLQDDSTLGTAGIEDGNTIKLVERIQQSSDNWSTINETGSTTLEDVAEGEDADASKVTTAPPESAAKDSTETPDSGYVTTKPKKKLGSYRYGQPRAGYTPSYTYNPYTYEVETEYNVPPRRRAGASPERTPRRARHTDTPRYSYGTPEYVSRKSEYAYSTAEYGSRKPQSVYGGLRYEQPEYLYARETPAYIYAGTEHPRGARPRPRRPATSTTLKDPSKPKPSRPEPRKATEEDAKKHRIPAGYSLKNWDPTEEPITLLGSVFDANSLGKWIYDWTVYCYKAPSPLADLAGELWLSLIKLAGKIKHAEETMPRIRTAENREMVDDFLSSGDRLWTRLKSLLRECEKAMLKAGRKDASGKVVMGKNAGIEFVKTLFDRDRQLEATEKMMHLMRLWDMRFEANCAEILNSPAQ